LDSFIAGVRLTKYFRYEQSYEESKKSSFHSFLPEMFWLVIFNLLFYESLQFSGILNFYSVFSVLLTVEIQPFIVIAKLR